MTIVALAREFAAKIQETEEYRTLVSVREESDKDETLQSMVQQFNALGAAMEREAESADPDQEAIDKLNAQLMQMYGVIMENQHMAAFNKSKTDIDRQMNISMDIISAAINGENPATYEPQAHEHGCGGGDCGGCGGGCH